MYEIGQLVLCTATSWISRTKTSSKTVKCSAKTPLQGNIYTIRGIYTTDGLTGLYFEEIVNKRAKHVEGYLEPCFDCRNFRLVRKPNIDSIRQILTDVNNGKIVVYEDNVKKRA